MCGWRVVFSGERRDVRDYLLIKFWISQLKVALKRGVEYGILKKTNAGYSLNTDAEVIGPFDMAQMDGCGKRRSK